MMWHSRARSRLRSDTARADAQIGARAATAAVFAVALAVSVFETLRVHRQVGDDAFITFRYARNLAHGHGWRYNLRGTTTNAATSFLWTCVLAVADRVTGSVVGAAQVLFDVCIAGTATLLFAGFRRAGSAVAGCFAAGLLLAAPWITYTLGMEYGLLLLLVVAASVAGTVCDRAALGGVLAALACFTRGEAALFVAALGAVVWWRGRRFPTAYAVGGLATAVPLAIVVLVVTGSLTPGTLDAKVAQGRSGYWGHGFVFVRGLARIPRASGFGAWWIAVVALAVVGAVTARRSIAHVAAPLALFAVAIVVLDGLVLRVPAYGWYYAPVVLGAVALAGAGAAAVVERATARPLRAAVVGVAAIAVAVSMVALPLWPIRLREYAEAGRWLELHTSRTSTVAATEIGLLGWSSNRPMVDYLGLLDERSVHDLEHRDLRSWLGRDRPDYWVVHAPAWGFEQAVNTREFRAHYRRVAVLPTQYSRRTRALVVYARTS